MYARIGAARALRKNIFSGDALNGGAQFALDRRPLRLDLPPVKLRAVIGKHQLPNLNLLLYIFDLGRHFTTPYG
jgi:hypothetical protein